jgi:transketolase
MALEAAKKAGGKKVQVVSVISRELFEAQPKLMRDALVSPSARVIAVEAGVRTGWEHWADDVFTIDRFGESGPADKVAAHLGFTADALAALISK